MRLYTNNGVGQLASGITDSATTVTLQTGQGALFPAIGTNQYFHVTVVDSANNREIMRVTGRAGDVLTVVRGQEGTTPRAYIAGDRVELRETAAGLNQRLAAGMVRNTADAGGTVDALTAAFPDTTDAALEDRMTVVVTAAGANTVVAPTINVTIGGAATGVKDIVKGANSPLVAGDIPGAEYPCVLQYSASLDKWVLLNPATSNRLTEAKAAGFTINAADAHKTFFCSGTFTVTLSAASALGNGFSCSLFNTGTGIITIGTVKELQPNEGVAIKSDGSVVRVIAETPTLRKQVFTASGTFTVPYGVKRVKVTVVGGGGGGGGYRTSPSIDQGAGGGGGGTAIKWVDVTPNDAITVTVGAGGGGSSGGATAATGGTSSFGTHCSATGGLGGTSSGGLTTNSARAGGVGVDGDLNIAGDPSVAKAGGASGGGSTHGGGGSGGTNGSTGREYGGGASGNIATANNSGASGAAGVVIVEW